MKTPEKKLASNRVWAEKHREERLAYKRQHYLQNRERYLAAAKKWREDHPDEAKSLDLKKKYGITVEDKRTMLAEQNGRCVACGSDSHQGRYPGIDGWHVDHDHKTDKIRALLCHPCNLTLGNSQESPDRLRALAAYLERYA